MWFTIFCMLFGASLVPWYFVIKGTGLLNSIWALVIPSAVPVYNVILLMNFFRLLSLLIVLDCPKCQALVKKHLNV